MAEDKQEQGEGAQMSLIGHLTELRANSYKFYHQMHLVRPYSSH